MKSILTIAAFGAVLSLAVTSQAEFHGPVFYGDAPDAHHPWTVHDQNRPQPTIVTPGTFSTQDQPGKPPSDAVVLFDGTDLSKWEADNDKHEPTKWVAKNGAMECVPGSGYIRTKESFGDCQLHVEWAAPTKVEGDSQGRGNSGVFLMGQIEIQVLDNYDNPTYADGMAGSMYCVNPPMVNGLRKPGEFQTYDIVFRRPIYKNGQCVDPGYVTVFENGILVQDHTMIEGGTGHMGRARPGAFPEVGPLKLQDHGNPVRYRNVWYRPLPPRAIEGGTDGYLTSEATTAKRKQIAESIRQNAATIKETVPQMRRYAESLVYDNDDATFQKVTQMANDYVANLKGLPADQIASKKDEAKGLRDAFGYLIRFERIPADFAPKAQLDQVIKDNKWDKR